MEQRPRARLRLGPERRGSVARRDDRRERRRHADDSAVRDRRSADLVVPAGHGVGGDAGRVRVRERAPAAHRHEQHRARRAVRSQAARDVLGERLDARSPESRGAGDQIDLPIVRCGRSRHGDVHAVRARRSPAEPRDDVRVVFDVSEAGWPAQRAGRRASLQAGAAGRADGLRCGASAANRRARRGHAPAQPRPCFRRADGGPGARAGPLPRGRLHGASGDDQRSVRHVPRRGHRRDRGGCAPGHRALWSRSIFNCGGPAAPAPSR